MPCRPAECRFVKAMALCKQDMLLCRLSREWEEKRNLYAAEKAALEARVAAGIEMKEVLEERMLSLQQVSNDVPPWPDIGKERNAKSWVNGGGGVLQNVVPAIY